MRFAATLTVGGVLGFIILEALKILMEPVVAWVMATLALALKVLLIALGGVAALGALGLGVFFFMRAKRARADA